MGLFGAGAALVKVFPSPWMQPAVLLALGIAFLFVSRPGPRAQRAKVAPLPARPAASAAPAPATVPVEQSA